MCLKVKEFNVNLSIPMDITYLGHSSFKIKGKIASVVTDPYNSDKVGFKFPKTEADIVTVSHSHDDHNNFGEVVNVKKVVSGPGEYEVNGVSIIGIQTFHDDKKGQERGKNTVYVIEIEGIRLLHLGDLGHKLDEATVKEVGNIDVLFIPVGGTYTIDAKTAVIVQKQIGPSVIIPMHYGDKLAPVEDFLKESGLRVERLAKLSLKQADIKSDEEYAVVFGEKK